MLFLSILVFVIGIAIPILRGRRIPREGAVLFNRRRSAQDSSSSTDSEEALRTLMQVVDETIRVYDPDSAWPRRSVPRIDR